MNALIETLATRRYISTEDVLKMRRRVFGDQVVDRDEMADLIQLGQQAPEGDDGWRQFLGEALADFFLRQAEPRGYMSEESGEFLLTCLGTPGEVSPVLLDALSHLVRHAQSVPRAVVDFGMEAIFEATLADGVIDAVEADRIRGFLFATGSDGNVAISRAEADFLFDLNDAARDGGNDPAWADLFMKAIANHLMAHLGYEPPSRREALRRQAWLEDASVDYAGFIGRMTAGGFGAVLDAYRRRDPAAEKNARRAADVARSAQLTAEEVCRVTDRIGRDGTYNEAEQALVAWLGRLHEGKDLPAPLAKLASRA